ncbi:MAG: O-antigen ligase family protein [Cellvibrionaceae bacterium]|nr:O-antigen ligase family protein [Cellvibrionaceae bacterium]
MSAALASYLIILFAIALGAAVCLFVFNSKVVLRVAALWVGLVTVSLFGNMWALAAVILGAAVVVRDLSAETKIFYFVALLPVIPLEVFILPFPGLNSLWELSAPRLLVLGLLLPSFLHYLKNSLRGNDIFRMSDLYFASFVILMILLSVRSGGVTVAMRTMLSYTVEFLIPYFVLSRYIYNTKSLDWVLTAFLISASFLSFAAIIETLMKWRFYSEILISLNLDYSPLSLVPNQRGGMVRASGGSMLQPLAFAYFASMAMVVCFYMLKRRMIPRFWGLGFFGIVFVALLFTGSRGGLLAFMIGVCMIYYFNLPVFTRLVVGVAAAFLLFLGLSYLAAAGLSSIDSEGSFQYRLDLIMNSLNAVRANLLFGAADFLNDPTLEKSRQGEGIIDVVNLYLQVILKYGVVGLFLYIMSYLAIFYGVLKKKNVAGDDYKSLLLAMIVLTMVFIGTCSDVSFIPWYIVWMLALSRAYIEFPVKPPARPLLTG